MRMTQYMILGPSLLRFNSVKEYVCLERLESTLDVFRSRFQAGKEENWVNNRVFTRKNLCNVMECKSYLNQYYSL